MHKILIFSALIILLNISGTYCQEEGRENARFAVSYFYLLGGEITQVENTTSVEKFQNFLPQANILKANFSDFSYGGSGNGRNSSAIFSVMAGFARPNSQRQELRFGASVFSNAYVSAYQNKQTVAPTDTLTSSQTGEKFYVRKDTFQYYGMHSQSVDIGLDAAYIYHFFPDDRISFFTGIGIGSSFSLNAHTDIYYSAEYYSIVNRESGYGMIGPDGWVWSDMPVRINHKGNFGVNVYVPLGLDFRLNEKGAFHKTHLLYEFRPGFNAQFGGLGDFSGLQWQHTFGLKFDLKNNQL